jgi:hypothetical protein
MRRPLCSASARGFRVNVTRAPLTSSYPERLFLFHSYRSAQSEVREVLVFAVQFDRFGPPEVLSVGPFPEPHAGREEVRVRIRAAGVSPVDAALRAGDSPSRERVAFPHIPGVDAAGVVDEVGEDVTGTKQGTELFGAVDVSRLGGASAEYAVLRFWAANRRRCRGRRPPRAVQSIETATRVLDLLDVREGTTLLIDGAAGGVGSVAVQLAPASVVTIADSPPRDAKSAFRSATWAANRTDATASPPRPPSTKKAASASRCERSSPCNRRPRPTHSPPRAHGTARSS